MKFLYSLFLTRLISCSYCKLRHDLSLYSLYNT